jgi:hypothetical protein
MADGNGNSQSAQHLPPQLGDFDVAPTDGSDKFNAIRIPLIPVACWRLDDPAFAFDSSFVDPSFQGEIGKLASIVGANQGCPAALFAHCDPVGSDALNKTLGDRRAMAIYALLTRQTPIWKWLYENPQVGDTWGTKAVQLMLSALPAPTGDVYYDGAIDGDYGSGTTKAVRAFQKDNALSVDGSAGPDTRDALYAKYMDWLCTSGSSTPFQMQIADFLGGAGAGPGDLPKMSLQSCGKFNPILLLASSEMNSGDTKTRNADDAPNRRVVMFLFPKDTKVDTAAWPCPKVKDGGDACSSAFWPEGDKRRTNGSEQREYKKTRDTMACRFYDRFARRSPCEGGGFQVVLEYRPAEAFCGDKLDLVGEAIDLPDGPLATTSKAREIDAPLLKVPDLVFASGKADLKLQAQNVPHLTIDTSTKPPTRTVYERVHVTTAAADTSVRCRAAKMLQKGMPHADEDTFTQHHDWSGFSNDAKFKQVVDKYLAKVTVTLDIQKGWGGTYVDFSGSGTGITGTVAGGPGTNMRWARSTAGTSVPDQYHDGTAWKALPAGFALTAANYNARSFYKSGANFVAPDSAAFVFPGGFTDYDFDDPALVKVRNKWIQVTHDKWTGQFHIHKKKCVSDKSVRCCRYDVEVTLVLNKVNANAAGVVIVASGDGRSNAGLFFMGDSDYKMAAHESGHHMDNPDEYANGAVDPTLNGDGAVNGIDATCIMGQSMNLVKKRHYHAFATLMQRQMKAKFGQDDEYEIVDIA